MSKTPKPPLTERAIQIETWAKRRAEIVAHHKAGWTLSQIGVKFGMSRTRAHQIVKEAGA